MPTSKGKKPSKHPRHMTTEEVVKHLFHPDVVQHLKNETSKPKPKPLKKA
jgi:hypothetical protein